MSDWIFCKDRLPDETGTYLVYRLVHGSLIHSILFYLLDSGTFKGKGGWSCQHPKDVIAWMPLPKAPKLEEE